MGRGGHPRGRRARPPLRPAGEQGAAGLRRGQARRGGLDFDDLLIKTRDLLRDHAAAVRDAPHGALERVLVDEFQDTDPIQGEILERLAGEAFPSGRLFLVGDSKQSIYRFRGRGPRSSRSSATGSPKRAGSP